MATAKPQHLNLPPFDAATRVGADGSRTEIFDPLRHRWVTLTPEEHVRQAFVAMLAANLGYPKGRMANEVTIDLNGQPVRCDTLIYDGNARPLAIVEYKAPNVPLTQKTIDQIARYSIALGTRWLIISNGLTHFCAEITDGNPPSCRFLDHIPEYSQLSSARS